MKHDFELLVNTKRRTPAANLNKFEDKECARLNKIEEAERILKASERGKSAMKLTDGPLRKLMIITFPLVRTNVVLILATDPKCVPKPKLLTKCFLGVFADDFRGDHDHPHITLFNKGAYSFIHYFDCE